MFKSTITALSAAAFIITPAAAEDFSFKYQSHELDTAAAAQTLYSRLVDRVESFCTTSGSRPISMKIAEADCVSQTLDEAVSGINHPRLDRLLAQTNGAGSYASRRSYDG